MKRFFVLVSLTLCAISLLHAASDTLYPEVGKPCPDFVLKNVNYYNKKQVTLADFKGKWLVLDFWNKYCSACVESFPETNAMEKKFGDRVQFILIGIQDAEGQIRTMYERFQKRLNLTLPCAFDSTLSDYWGIVQTPHILVIDEKGIIQARTLKLESADIAAFLEGKHPNLTVITHVAQRKELFAPDIGEQRIPFDRYKPFMINGNGSSSDTNYLYRSILSKWNQANQYGEMPNSIYYHAFRPNYPKGVFQVMGVTLRQLYLYAYFGAHQWYTDDSTMYGKYYNLPILQVHDSSLFQATSTENRFCYSLILPPAKGGKENLQKAMQRDLQTYFGYDVSIEIRSVPYWRLVMSDKKAAAALKAKRPDDKLNKYGRQEALIPNVEYRFSNYPIQKLLSWFADISKGIVLDETRIESNIDITLDGIDFDELKKSLLKNGLELIPSEKEMKVLVIRDPKN